MNRLARSRPRPWTARLRNGDALRQPGREPSRPPFAARPGIAARWKPRDRVNAAGN